ncbi:MAG TPA: hypothetical protein VNX68_19360 [Nitrosopumilaceae archaeon]|jgi:hypothetical protein|nr:hypothetical protein [Nitrosopumilaceae archaeon]
MDELATVKTNLLSELNVQYSNLINFLLRTPIHQKFKDYCFKNLDEGIFWVQKGIEHLQMQEKNKTSDLEINNIQNQSSNEKNPAEEIKTIY